MTRRQKTIIVILVVLLIIALFGAFILLTQQKKPQTPGTGPDDPFAPGTGVGPGNNGQNPGNGGIIVEPGTGGNTGTTTNPGTVVPTIPKLRKISQVPVAGAVAFERGDETVIRYIDQVSGHIYETHADDLATEKISNTTIPQVKEAIWTPEGDAVYIRYTRDGTEAIETYYAKLRPAGSQTVISATGEEISQPQITTAEYEIEGTFLPRDVKNITFEPGKNRIFTLTKTNNRGIGAVSLRDAVKRTEILNTPIKDWIIQWPKDKTLTLNTKASGTTEGYLYFLNTDTGNMDGAISAVDGLTSTTNSDISYTFYSFSSPNGIESAVLDLNKRTTMPSPVKTLADKCVWSKKVVINVYCSVPQTIPSALYPDAWYQGTVSFNDDLWKINVAGDLSAILVRPENEIGASIDMIKLFLDPQEHYVFFINKKDGYLWSYDVSEEFF